jgi:16S rRNA (adenine1518-N6/adenine1519-N6)-dimethyltransferase
MYKLKKSLGQHFLKDESVIEDIYRALCSNSFERLLEVGPGGGALTRHLLTIPNIDFKAVEIDEEKIAFLQKTFKSIEGKIISASILDIESPFEQPFTVIGNFPYNISSQILFKMLDWRDRVPVVVGMFQKEVAERVASAPCSKDYGVLSILIQAFYEVEYLFDVKPECFNPPPKVMSGVIRLTRRAEPIPMKSEKAFRLLVKTAFNQRRKTLRNALKGLLPAEELQKDLYNKRAEELSVATFAELSFLLFTA